MRVLVLKDIMGETFVYKRLLPKPLCYLLHSTNFFARTNFQIVEAKKPKPPSKNFMAGGVMVCRETAQHLTLSIKTPYIIIQSLKS